MDIELYFQSKKLLRIVKVKNRFLAVFDDTSSITRSHLYRKDCDIVCRCCKKVVRQRLNWNIVANGYFECQSCCKTGSKNSFAGKTHSCETKGKISLKNKGKSAGSKNFFYGYSFKDTLSAEQQTNLSRKRSEAVKGDKNPFFGKKHSDDTKKKISENSKRWANTPENKEKLRDQAIEYLKRNKYRKTKPEKMMELLLKENQIEYKYNHIMFGYQYDFLISDNILVEVHGDYWHGNPKFYSLDQLNGRQKFKIAQDIKKKNCAELAGYKYLFVYEDDLNKNNLNIINQIKDEISKNQIKKTTAV